MKFTVTWTRDSLELLAALWIEARDRSAVTRATDEIDRLLTIDPLAVGESRVVDIRILIEPPVAVYYDVNSSDRKVTVWHVWSVHE